jgi:hypothetical protein
VFYDAFWTPFTGSVGSHNIRSTLLAGGVDTYHREINVALKVGGVKNTVGRLQWAAGGEWGAESGDGE